MSEETHTDITTADTGPEPLERETKALFRWIATVLATALGVFLGMLAFSKYSEKRAELQLDRLQSTYDGRR